MSPLEIELLACIREYRRLNNQTVVNVIEKNAVHLRADALLRNQPELDDPNERFDAPFRIEHREFIDSLFSKSRR